VSSDLRLSDAERQRAADALGEHYAAGRLDVAEHAERLDRVMAAKTYAELPAIFADLPGGSPVASPGVAWSPRMVTPADRSARFPAPPHRRGPLPGLWIVLLVLAVGIVLTQHFWLVLVALGAWFVLGRGRRRSCAGRPRYR
jgi:hypothetical protein